VRSNIYVSIVLTVIGLACVAGALRTAPAAGAGVPLLAPSFRQIATGSAGGSLWQGAIRNPDRPALRRETLVYLPPEASSAHRYPVFYVLHGMPGDPYSIAGMNFVGVADQLVSTRAVQPFIAVMPPAGSSVRFMGEWAGIWEQYVVRSVVPWIDANLPTLATRASRTLAGLSGGGYGAVDIGLRHPGLFGTLESWSGYFTAPTDLGSGSGAGSSVAAHDPTLIVQHSAALLRALGTRFFLSSGTGDATDLARARAFAQLLDANRLPRRLVIGPGGHDWRFWHLQLAAAIEYAFGRVPK
jgi:enterochelin esterase-like enzyme